MPAELTEFLLHHDGPPSPLPLCESRGDGRDAWLATMVGGGCVGGGAIISIARLLPFLPLRRGGYVAGAFGVYCGGGGGRGRRSSAVTGTPTGTGSCTTLTGPSSPS
mmetsp:Transcript_34688/g.75008  ORF Transcript_34688/g.75008 Transcript_34688/m.75008 type:complete len:107 (+) Transcript_34688:775-1095(+)